MGVISPKIEKSIISFFNIVWVYSLQMPFQGLTRDSGLGHRGEFPLLYDPVANDSATQMRLEG